MCTWEESGQFSINGTPGWNYRQRLNIHNNVASQLPTGYSVRLVLDTVNLVNAGKLRSDGNDLRVLWFNGTTPIELDRFAETAFNTANTEIWFRTQATIAGNTDDANYWIYYGNPSANAAPANRANVYALWDDLDGSALDSSRWNVTAGTVTVSDGQAHLASGANMIGRTSFLNTSLEMRVQLVGENDYVWWGWEDQPANAPNFIVFEETSSNLGAWRSNDWTMSQIVLADPAGGLTTWHTYVTDWWPGNARWLIDDAQVASTTTNVPDTGMYANLYAYAVPMNVDWVKARLRVAAEPSVTACVPEPTPTPTPTSTPSPTPTFTPTPLPTLIWADSFESGNLSAWTSSVTDGGDLSVSAAAAITGSWGLQALLDDNVAIYVTDDRPLAETLYRASFYFDPNSITMTSGNAHYIFYGYTGTSTVVLRVEFLYNAGSYQIRANVRDDGNVWTNTAWVTISDTLHRIEFDWRAATSAGANNGGLTLWIDGSQQSNLTTLDNDTRRIDRVRLGPVGGIDTGTRGTYYFDGFESYRN